MVSSGGIAPALAPLCPSSDARHQPVRGGEVGEEEGRHLEVAAVSGDAECDQRDDDERGGDGPDHVSRLDIHRVADCDRCELAGGVIVSRPNPWSGSM